MKAVCIDFLKRYTGKQSIYLAQRGNKAIYAALKIAKMQGKEKAIIQDQGGWITYLQYPEQVGLKIVKLPTADALIEPDVLTKHLDSSTVLLVNSLSGYFVEQPMALISSIAKQKNALLINDASGSIGTAAARFGDIIIGSFGEHKPINLMYGGFLATDLHGELAPVDNLQFDQAKMSALAKELQTLEGRLHFFEVRRKQILNDLLEYDVIHREKNGINIMVAFQDDVEKEKILKYCQRNNLEWTECPRYIRVMRQAISIEVKRLRP